MSSITGPDLRVFTAEQIKNSIPNGTQLYLTYGRSFPWANDLSPDVANTSIATDYEVWRYMVGGKTITGNDVRHAIPRYNWVANTVYTQYDDLNTDLANSNFYVLTSDNNIYKCLYNNYTSNSTVMPTSISQSTTSSTSDGYIWKYMYTLSPEEQLRFTTDGFIPVKTVLAYDGSLQWLVQEAANPGGIDSIIVTSGGNAYSNQANLVVTVGGDGVAATATGNINVTTGQVESVIVTNPGTGYTNAFIVITQGGGSGATARPIIPPFGGHGVDAVYELGGKNLIINTTIQGSENGTLPIEGDYRQISILMNPSLFALPNVAVVSTFDQTTGIALTGVTSDFQEDEFVYQGPSLNFSDFSGRVNEWDSGNNILKLIDVRGTPISQTLVGDTSAATAFLTSVINPDLQKDTGKFLYVGDITPIQRSEDQFDNFQILLSF